MVSTLFLSIKTPFALSRQSSCVQKHKNYFQKHFWRFLFRTLITFCTFYIQNLNYVLYVLNFELQLCSVCSKLRSKILEKNFQNFNYVPYVPNLELKLRSVLSKLRSKILELQLSSVFSKYVLKFKTFQNFNYVLR